MKNLNGKKVKTTASIIRAIFQIGRSLCNDCLAHPKGEWCLSCPHYAFKKMFEEWFKTQDSIEKIKKKVDRELESKTMAQIDKKREERKIFDKFKGETIDWFGELGLEIPLKKRDN